MTLVTLVKVTCLILIVALGILINVTWFICFGDWLSLQKYPDVSEEKSLQDLMESFNFHFKNHNYLLWPIIVSQIFILLIPNVLDIKVYILKCSET